MQRIFCKECGRSIGDCNICPFCNARQKPQESVFYSFSDFYGIADDKKTSGEEGTSSRLTAGILQLFCGSLGIGRFYMGCKTYAVLQILSSLVTCGIGGVLWGFMDGIMILTGAVRYDGKGNLLV